MTEAQAQALLLLFAQTGMCVRFEVDARGDVVYATEAPRRPSRTTTKAAGLAAAAALVAAGCAGNGPAPVAAKPPPAAEPPPVLAVPSPAEAPTRRDADATARPATRDADGDGVEDDKDACPLAPGSAQRSGCPILGGIAHQGVIQIIQHVTFKFGDVKPLPQNKILIDEVAKVFAERPELTRVAIEGHASPDEPNALKLSRARAQKVADALAARGVDSARLVVEAHGKDRPLDEGASRESREKNRRVAFRIVEQAACPTPASGP